MSNKSLIGGVLGAIVGFVGSAFNPVAAYQGFLIGSTIGAAFTDTQLEPGPRMEDLEQNDSSYGEVIPRLYGTDQLTANIIWLKNNKLDEVSEEVVIQEGLFSDVTQTQYKYYASFAVQLCEGVIDNIKTIWANDEIIYQSGDLGSTPGSLFKSTGDNQITLKSVSDVVDDFGGGLFAALDTVKVLKGLKELGLNIRIYKGTLDQDVDPLIKESLGDDTSAFRGVAYIVFDNLSLTNERFQNQIPRLRFEVTKNSTDIEIGEGDVRTFASTYVADRVNGEPNSGAGTLINTNVGQQGSIYHTGASSIVSYKGGGRFFSENYALDNGLLYNLSRFEGSSPLFLTTTYLGGYSKIYNLEYNNSDGTTTFYTNRVFWPYTHQIHDISNLSVAPQSEGTPTAAKQSTTLLKEEEVVLFDFDMTDSTLPSSIQPIVKPIQNLPGWVIVARGTSLQVGYIESGRFLLWNTRLNLNESFEDGTSEISVNFGDSLDNFEDDCRNLRAFQAGGLVYVYMGVPASTTSNWFPGVIRLDLSSYIGSKSAILRDVTKYPANSTVSIGGTSYIKNTTVDTFRVITVEAPFRQMFPEDVLWNKNFAFSVMAYDYQEDALYGVLDIVGSQLSGGFLSSSYSTDPTISVQPPQKVIRIDRKSLQDLSNLAGDFYISDKDCYTTASKAVTCARVYEGWLDYGVQTYKLSDSVAEGYYLVTNGNSYVDNDLSTSYTEGGAEKLALPNFSGSVPKYCFNLLPDLSLSGNEKASLYTRGNYWSATNTSFDTLVGLPDIQRHIITFNGDLNSLFASTPGIEIGEALTAESLRSGKISSTDLDFTGLDTIINGISIKDRGTTKNIAKSLQESYLFDIIEKDYKIFSELRKDKTVRRTISYEELSAGEGESSEEIIITTPTRGQVPSKYYLTYRSQEGDYFPQSIVWQDPSVTGEITLDIKVPVVLTEQEAYDLIRRRALSTISARQGNVEVTTIFKHSDLDLGDYITLNTSDGFSYTIRITELSKGRPGLVKITGIVDNPANYNFSKDGFQTTFQQEQLLAQIATPIVINGLPFKDTQDGVSDWVGAYSVSNDEIFASIMAVTDNFNQTIARGKPLFNTTPVGFCVDSLPVPTTEGDFDYTSDLTFKPLAFSEGFNTQTEEEVLSDAFVNTFWYGQGNSWELIKILNFTDNSDGTYTASGILRGYKGTSHLGLHEDGHYLVHAGLGTLNRVLFNLDRVGQIVKYSLLDPSPAPNSIISKQIGYGNRLPMPPINIQGYKKSDGTFYVEWTRQARHTVEWINGFDVPLDEETEQYYIYTLDPDNDNEILSTDIVTDTTNTILPDTGSTVTIAIAQYSEELQRVGYISNIVTI
ncbi:MAG: putative tail protein [Prokaryotic dsDNA virus sp.]|nr:MAG: putative tail protein [Prokaryotic dsDNA virus sp.]|tara:strand:+ start:23762 stop:27805 length:4044 start_codon:yes stop_codon:yes gene_type:complete